MRLVRVTTDRGYRNSYPQLASKIESMVGVEIGDGFVLFPEPYTLDPAHIELIRSAGSTGDRPDFGSLEGRIFSLSSSETVTPVTPDAPPAPAEPGKTLTFNEHGNAMLEKIDIEKRWLVPGEASREMALAKTHLEDALTRFNSAAYRIRGIWNRQDPELLG